MRPVNTPELGNAVPKRGNWLSRAFCRALMFFLGWRFEGTLPNISHFVIVGGPHTSSWDFPLSMMALFAVGLRVSWLGKHTFVNGRFRRLLHWMGGVPVDRSVPNGLVAQAAAQFRARPHFVLGLSPEGTRRLVKRWKLGFYHIARAANVPIVPLALDYGRKTIGLGAPISASEDLETVLGQLQQFFDGVQGHNADKGFMQPLQSFVSHENEETGSV